MDVVNDDDADLPNWPIAEEYEHREQNEVSPEVLQLLEQRLQQLDALSLGGTGRIPSLLTGRFTARSLAT